jgi:hypothetical protein
MEHVLSREDVQLVDGLRARDEAAFAALIRMYGAGMLRVSWMYVSSRAVAEEVVQEARHPPRAGDSQRAQDFAARAIGRDRRPPMTRNRTRPQGAGRYRSSCRGDPAALDAASPSAKS